MSTTTIVTPNYLTAESDAILQCANGVDLIVASFTTEIFQNPYSPPVWNMFGNVDKVPMNPRIHWRKFR